MRTVIVPHMGVSDHLNLQGLIRHYAQTLSGTLIVTEQGNCKEMVQMLYCDLSNVEVYSDPAIYPEKMFNDQYLMSVTNSTNLIRIGFNTIDWKDYPNMSFIEGFYHSKGVPTEYRYTNFRIPDIVRAKAKQVYEEFVAKHGPDYIVIHEEPGHKRIKDCTYSVNRGEFFPLQRNEMDTSLPIINLDQISNGIIDYYEVLLHAKEIHFIDSIWANFTYILTLSEKAFQTKKIVLHEYARSNKNTLLFRKPSPGNWIFLTE
jgi:glycerol-3-phosphate cytidylyltransferase-like family protein